MSIQQGVGIVVRALPVSQEILAYAPTPAHLSGDLFKLTLNASATSNPTILQGNLFKIGLQASGGANLNGSLFKLTGSLAGTNNPNGIMAGNLFKLTGSISGTVEITGGLDATVIMSGTLSSFGGASLASGSRLFKITGSATGIREITGALAGNLFKIQSEGTITKDILGRMSGNLFKIETFASSLRGNLFSIALGSSGTVGVAAYTTYAINIRTGEMTTYSNFHFNQVLRLNGRYYGVTSTAIYLLEGDTDAGTKIATSLKTRPIDFDVQNYKRVPYVYLGSTNQVQVTTYTDGTMQGAFHGEAGKKRVKLARGPKSRYWQFKIENVCGNDFKLDSIDLLVETLSRKAG
jgi:hypothetical protein